MSEITVTTSEPSFLKQLVAFEDGQVDMDLRAGWDEVLAAVAKYGKAGSLSLSITITPDKEDDNVLAVKAEVKVKPPTRPAEPEVWVRNGTGGAVRSQLQLPGMSKADEHGGTGAFDGMGEDAGAGPSVSEAVVDAIRSSGLGSTLKDGESITISHPASGKSATLDAETARKLRAV